MYVFYVIYLGMECMRICNVYMGICNVCTVYGYVVYVLCVGM